MLGKRKGKARASKVQATKKVKKIEEDLNVGDVDSGDDASSDDNAVAKVGDEGDVDDDFFETADEKRVRLAKEYLATVDAGAGREAVQERLQQDVDANAKRTRTACSEVKFGEARFLKGHKESPTCIAMSSDEKTIFTGGKDCAILRWDVETGKKDVFPGGRNLFESGGHFEQVLDVALVEQRNLLLSVGVDRVVRTWDWRCPPKTACTQKLPGHQGSITSVVVEPDGSQFYTGGLDKSMKVWDFATGKCLDTMFGHVAGVTHMDLYQQGRPASVGADKTVRLWKVERETHLVFSKHTYSVDAVSVLDSDRLVSGGQDGSIMLWSHNSKKPLASARLPGHDQWVTALGSIRSSNVFFSGSSSGKLQTFQAITTGGKKPTTELTEIVPAATLPGRVNGIAVGKQVVACAVGKEHRLGGWFHERGSKNGLYVVPLSYTSNTVT